MKKTQEDFGSAFLGIRWMSALSHLRVTASWYLNGSLPSHIDIGNTILGFLVTCHPRLHNHSKSFSRNPAAADADRPGDGIQQRGRGPAGPTDHQQLRATRSHALVLELQHVKKANVGRWRRNVSWARKMNFLTVVRSMLMMITHEKKMTFRWEKKSK